MSAPAGPDGAQLFVIDPIERLNPAKDSSVALMQAAQRAGLPVWVCTPADISAAEHPQVGHTAWALARPAQLEAIAPGVSLLSLLKEDDPSLQALAARETTRRVRALSATELERLDF